MFLTSSGTEANEAAVKLTRRHSDGKRPRLIAMEHAFHGRTMGALALTHKAAYREPFEPLPPGVEFVPYGDAAALEAVMGPDVAAVFVEPIQGEAGVQIPPPGYLAAVREEATRRSLGLLAGEVTIELVQLTSNLTVLGASAMLMTAELGLEPAR